MKLIKNKYFISININKYNINKYFLIIKFNKWVIFIYIKRFIYYSKYMYNELWLFTNGFSQINRFWVIYLKYFSISNLIKFNIKKLFFLF